MVVFSLDFLILFKLYSTYCVMFLCQSIEAFLSKSRCLFSNLLLHCIHNPFLWFQLFQTNFPLYWWAISYFSILLTGSKNQFRNYKSWYFTNYSKQSHYYWQKALSNKQIDNILNKYNLFYSNGQKMWKSGFVVSEFVVWSGEEYIYCEKKSLTV